MTSSLSLNYSTALACATSTRTNRNTLLLPNNGSPPQTRFHAFLSLSNAVKKFVTFSHWPWPESLSQIPFIPNFETHPPLILIFFYCFRSILVSHFFLSTSPQSKTPRLETLQSDLQSECRGYLTHRTHTFFSCCLLASKAAPLLFCFLFFCKTQNQAVRIGRQGRCAGARRRDIPAGFFMGITPLRSEPHRQSSVEPHGPGWRRPRRHLPLETCSEKSKTARMAGRRRPQWRRNDHSNVSRWVGYLPLDTPPPNYFRV